MSDEILISSYFPLYRSPPHPSQAIDWCGVEDRKLGITTDTTIDFEFSGNYSSCTGRTIVQILHCYIKAHPESLIFDEEAWLKGYTAQRLVMMSRSWAFHSSILHRIFGGCVVDFSAGPDDLLDFHYMQISVRVNVAEMAKLLLKDRYRLRMFLLDRYKDRRYKFLHQPEYKNVNYWLDPDNWVGFKAGILVDYCLSCILYRAGRAPCFKFPIGITDESGLYDVIKIDPVILGLFNDDRPFITWVARLFMGLKSRPMYWQMGAWKLDEGIDKFITYSIDKRRKELAEHVQLETTEGQQGEVLQTEQQVIRRLVQEGTLTEIRVQDDPIPDPAPAPVTIGAPVVPGDGIQLVHDIDGNTIGYARVDTGGTQEVARATELANASTARAPEPEGRSVIDSLMPGARAAFFEGLRLWREAGQPEIRNADGAVYPSPADAMLDNHPILRPAPEGYFLAHTAAEWTLQELNNAVATGRVTAGVIDSPGGVATPPPIFEQPAEVHGVAVMPGEQDLTF